MIEHRNRIMSALAALGIGMEIHKAIDQKIEEGDTRPFPLTKWEMAKIRRAVEKRHRKAERWRKEGR